VFFIPLSFREASGQSERTIGDVRKSLTGNGSLAWWELTAERAPARMSL
jgi:hypothetical protein